MHIPDGFLDAKTALGAGILALAGLGVALAEARRRLPPRMVPLLGVSAAFVFAAQLINFPVVGGTSGHLMGGVLAAALLGPGAAVIVISAVLIVQCFLFADGGITALGANVFNMAVVGAAGGWLVYAGLVRLMPGLRGRIFAAVVAGWVSTVLAAIACAGELAASGAVSWNAALPAMAGVHMLIGIGEGLITAAVLAEIAWVRPELVMPANGATAPWRYRAVSAYGLVAALGLAVFVAPFACGWPDGLDRVARTLGFAEHQHTAAAPAQDYKFPGIGSPGVATALAGGIGTVVVFGIGFLAARALTRSRKN